MRHSRFCRGIAVLSFVAALSGFLFGQQALYVSVGGKAMRLVRKMDDRTPYFFEKGRFERPAPEDTPGVAPRTYLLGPTEEYFPAFVSVRVVKAGFVHFNGNSVNRFDWRFQFTAAFTTASQLTDVFFVLEFETDDPQRKYYVQEIPADDLKQDRPISIEVSLPGTGTKEEYLLHVFSRGLEVFHSALPRPVIEGALSKMVAKRIADVRDAAPKPLTGPIPRYPEKLRGAKADGNAIVSCEITVSGQPINPTLVSASAPAFGEAALAVMSQWWFVPRVEKGRPVASRVELPFQFTPPKS